MTINGYLAPVEPRPPRLHPVPTDPVEISDPSFHPVSDIPQPFGSRSANNPTDSTRRTPPWPSSADVAFPAHYATGSFCSCFKLSCMWRACQCAGLTTVPTPFRPERHGTTAATTCVDTTSGLAVMATSGKDRRSGRAARARGRGPKGTGSKGTGSKGTHPFSLFGDGVWQETGGCGGRHTRLGASLAPRG